MRHRVMIPLSPDGFFAICSCGWVGSGRHTNKTDAIGDGAVHGLERLGDSERMTGDDLYSDFAQIFDHEKAVLHPAWEAFVRAMRGRAYGREAINDAWQWFRTGWEDS